MKIKNFKKKFIILSIVLILLGTGITFAGYGKMGFDYNRLRESAQGDAWYQTIHGDDNGLWYGVKIGNDLYLMAIGKGSSAFIGNMDD